jgi:hypothetical protein
MMHGGRFDRQIIMTSLGVDFYSAKRHQRGACDKFADARSVGRI